MGKRYKDGIYASSCVGATDQLLFRKAVVNGRLCMAYIKNDVVVALKDWEEANQEMYGPTPSLKITTEGEDYFIHNL
jgi:hypothetical protein